MKNRSNPKQKMDTGLDIVHKTFEFLKTTLEARSNHKDPENIEIEAAMGKIQERKAGSKDKKPFFNRILKPELFLKLEAELKLEAKLGRLIVNYKVYGMIDTYYEDREGMRIRHRQQIEMDNEFKMQTGKNEQFCVMKSKLKVLETRGVPDSLTYDVRYSVNEEIKLPMHVFVEWRNSKKIGYVYLFTPIGFFKLILFSMIAKSKFEDENGYVFLAMIIV